MKTWHWIAIGAMVLVVGYVFWRRRQTSAAPVVIGDKVGTSIGDAGAPPLPNLTMSSPPTAKLFTFVKPKAFGGF